MKNSSADRAHKRVLEIGRKHGLNERQISTLRGMADYDYKKYNFHCTFQQADSFDWRTLNALFNRGLLQVVGRWGSTLREGVAMTEAGRAIINEIKGKN